MMVQLKTITNTTLSLPGTFTLYEAMREWVKNFGCIEVKESVPSEDKINEYFQEYAILGRAVNGKINYLSKDSYFLHLQDLAINNNIMILHRLRGPEIN